MKATMQLVAQFGSYLEIQLVVGISVDAPKPFGFPMGDWSQQR